MVVFLFVLGRIVMSYAVIALGATVLFFVGTVLGFRSTGILLLIALTGFCVWICSLMQDKTSTVIVAIGYVIVGGTLYLQIIRPSQK